MFFQKQDMEGTHYTWDNPGKNMFAGQPTRRLFDRYNGDQVLFIINYYASLTGSLTVQEGRQLEEKLLNHLPMGISSEVSVFNWLKESGSKIESSVS